MGFSFPFLHANDLRLSSLIIRARIFYSLVRRGYIRKVSVQLAPKYFSRDFSTDSISCSERKKPEENNIKTRQQIKKERSKRCCRCQSTWIIIDPLSHRYRSDVATLSLRCRTAVAPLLHHYHYAVALLLLRCRTTIAPLSFCCHSSAVALLLRRGRTDIAPISHRYCSAADAPAIATKSHRYHTDITISAL